MPTFTDAIQQANVSGLPVVEGFAVLCEQSADTETIKIAVMRALQAGFPECAWEASGIPGEKWLLFRAVPLAAQNAGIPAQFVFPPLDRAWQAVRELKSGATSIVGAEKIVGIANAEPLLLSRLPVSSASDAQRAFRLWGKISDDRLEQIKQLSDRQNGHWSLQQMNVLDKQDRDGNVVTPGAWTIWREKHGLDKQPGDGVLVAHPDTGYTKHARLVDHLQENPSDPGHYGRNFVERENPDGEDPMQDRTLGNFPGHGTGTASIIVANADPPDSAHAADAPEADRPLLKPWGVAPGAKILPLRVSSSVVHLSFQNVCDAFVEAMERKAHVISMSLGGPLGSDLLNSLVQKALNQGIIIVAAAGNYAPTVAFPARIPGVIACAAGNVLNSPWRFSGLGAEVAITAPGELVWHDWRRVKIEKVKQAPPDGADIEEDKEVQFDDADNGNGTSFATANVAGLAALWLSYHGRDTLIQNHCKGQPELLPFLFRWCLEKSANAVPNFIKGGKGGFGAGIANAAKLLDFELPSPDIIHESRSKILRQASGGIVNFPVGSWWNILTLPTLAGRSDVTAEQEDVEERRRRITKFVNEVVGANCAEADRREINALVATNPDLQAVLDQVGKNARQCVHAPAVRRYLLRESVPLSKDLRASMELACKTDQEKWCKTHPELNVPYRPPTEEERDEEYECAIAPYLLPTAQEEERKSGYAIAPPPVRRLRAYALDPSLATRKDAAAINEITISIVFERDLLPGPVGDYLAVVDVDPASDCAYAPVNLNHPFLLAQDGLPRSEGNPQFHQQMVYAVAMKTIGHFEEALGRPIFWSSLRPWNEQSGDQNRVDYRLRNENGDFQIDNDGKFVYYTKNKYGKLVHDTSDRFVQRLRLYPHALREQNAYYSPQKRAILFGYFPSGDSDPGVEYPGGVVFTCLAHDIIAHEMTHAILDGMHVHFTEPSNPDVFAFHEAFADIVALFQRFTYPELLRNQIAKARGRLDAGTLMSQLALQFGQATGRHQAMRDALGHVVEQTRAADKQEWRDRSRGRNTNEGEEQAGVTIADAAQEFDEENRLKWKRFKADPSLLAQVEEPHERGSFLVAAVFDAYLAIYEDRIADLRRIATGGTGILPDGDMHPDLVNRMAGEAAKSAGHVLKMCIRAMDYVPPTDITFGEFLRALITADSDLVPNDTRRYRVAFIESFRKWGIYPRDVQTLSEDSLRWTSPPNGENVLFPDALNIDTAPVRQMRRALLGWQPGKPREAVWNDIKKAQLKLHDYLDKHSKEPVMQSLLCSIDLSRSFSVTNLRPARRIGPNGEFLTEMVVDIIQNVDALPNDGKERDAENAARQKEQEERERLGETEPPHKVPFRGGCTLIVSMDDFTVRYAINKRISSAARQARQREFLLRAGGSTSPDAAEYSSQDLPPGWYSQEVERAKWRSGRNNDREAMRASSCNCRRKDMEDVANKAASKSAANPGVSIPNPMVEPFALLHRK